MNIARPTADSTFGRAWSPAHADDKRFFPHNETLRSPDTDGMNEGGNHQTKVARSLLWYGYHDNPEGWVCPSSFDAFTPVNSVNVRETPRLWFWGGTEGGDLTLAPWIQGSDDDLQATTELSYGWTIKGMNTNVRSTALLGADRALRVDEDMSTDNAGELGNQPALLPVGDGRTASV